MSAALSVGVSCPWLASREVMIKQSSGREEFVSDMTVRASAAVSFYLPVVIVRSIYQRAGLRERRC